MVFGNKHTHTNTRGAVITNDKVYFKRHFDNIAVLWPHWQYAGCTRALESSRAHGAEWACCAAAAAAAVQTCPCIPTCRIHEMIQGRERSRMAVPCFLAVAGLRSRGQQKGQVRWAMGKCHVWSRLGPRGCSVHWRVFILLQLKLRERSPTFIRMSLWKNRWLESTINIFLV